MSKVKQKSLETVDQQMRSILTQNQRKALDVQRHLSVTANAGAGKTLVLVQRFVEILVNTDTAVDQLVAITFTDKAASELRKKITALIEEKIQGAKSNELVRRLERHRDQLTSANIGTIHAFCAALLRQYPVDANVDAAFTLLEGVDQQILEQEAIRATFDSLLRNSGDPHEREEFLDVVRMLGQWRVMKCFEVFLRKREQVERLLEQGGWLSERFSPDEVLERWNKAMTASVIKKLEESHWPASVERLLRSSKGKRAVEAVSLVQTMNDAASPEEKIKLYHQLSAIIFTKDGTLRKELIGSNDKASAGNEEELLSQLHESIGELCGNLSDPATEYADRILIRTTRSMLKMYRAILETYEAKKQEYGQLDFEDLQLKTRALLQREDIRNKIGEKFKYIMVDEYQDTNRLQYDIIRSLVSDYTSGNLFIVGDPKQSIYGFRNAEVEIFEATKKDIDTSSQQGTLVLPESFRLLSNIVAFINRVFSSIMNDHRREFAVRYDELVKGRVNSAEGNVELLLVPDQDSSDEHDGEVDSGAPAADESLMIARRLTELMQTSYQIYDKKSEKAVPFQFHHAAILLRDRKYVRAIEKALVAYNIPYVLSGGIGFYQTQEILDFLNYLKFLLNVDDDVALVGVLRSPFFTISDAELFEISLNGAEESFWMKTRRYAGTDKATEFLRRAVTILSDDAEVAKRLPVPFLVHRILTNTGWRGTIAGSSDNEQHLANVDKLLRLSREFAGRSFTALYDFVERLTLLVEQEEREAQASLEIEGNRVHIMTIHAAKGLEFPVVILPYSHQEFRYDNAPFVDAGFGVGLKVRDTNDFTKELTPSLYLFLRQRNRRKIEEEEKRIFYVACTRARDALIISGRLDSLYERPSYLKWTLEGLGIRSVPLNQGEITFPPESIRVVDIRNEQQQTGKLEHALRVNILLSQTERNVKIHSFGNGNSIPDAADVDIHPIISQTRGEFFSATQIKTFLECPTKYFLKFHLGVPEENAPSVFFDEEEDPNDEIRGDVEGTLTHSALQLISSADMPERDIEHQVRALVDATVPEREQQRDAMTRAIVDNVRRFSRSQFGGRVLASKEVHTEYSLSALFGDDFITGTIDRLYKNDEGQWSIVDYKTDRLGVADVEQRAAMYRPQLIYYALLVRKHFQQPSVPAALFFLRHPDHPVQFIFSERDIDEFEKNIGNVINKIKANDFSRSVYRCETCTYKKGDGCLISYASGGKS